MAATVYPNGEVSFVYRPEAAAEQVFLAGSFSGWVLGARRMQRSEDGTFRARLALPAGLHHYRFIVDGRWVADPEAAVQAPNMLGTVDSVVRVPHAQPPPQTLLSHRPRPAASALGGRAGAALNAR